MKKMVLLLTWCLVACDGDMTVSDGEDKVRATLRDPSSAEFTQEVVHPAQGSHGPVTCGYVNAKNGFGGMTGPRRFVAGGTTLVDDDQSETGQTVFNGVWNNLCGPAS